MLAAWIFDLKYKYVLRGWLSTTLDSRIIKNVLTRACSACLESMINIVEVGLHLQNVFNYENSRWNYLIS